MLELTHGPGVSSWILSQVLEQAGRLRGLDVPGQADLSRDLVAPHDGVAEVSPVQDTVQVPHDILQTLQEMPPAPVGQGQGVQQCITMVFRTCGESTYPQGHGPGAPGTSTEVQLLHNYY